MKRIPVDQDSIVEGISSEVGTSELPLCERTTLT